MRILLVIPPEVVMEVEARMNRNYMPPNLPTRKHSRHKPPLPTVQELQGRLLECYLSYVHSNVHFIWVFY